MKKQMKPKLTEQEKAEKKKRQEFSKQINDIFVNSGFDKLNVKNWHFDLGSVDIELDHCFVFENILIICEDTARKSALLPDSTNNSSQHKIKKDRAANLILQNKKKFIGLLKGKCPDCQTLSEYVPSEFKIFYLYFDYDAKRYSKSDREMYSNLTLVDRSVYQYFAMMSKSIKKSFRYELFRYLKLKENEVGKASPHRENDDIRANIIYPVNSTGYPDDIRIVSFMMAPDKLIKYSYVLRKDGWDEDTDLYQRLITAKRIKSVRKFVCDKKTSFLNNVIVTLPQNVKIFENTADGQTEKNWDDLARPVDKQYSIVIPSEYNSIGIIDGQHRIYAYFEDNNDSDEEKKVAKLRSELNLLVTGIIYKRDGKYFNNVAEQRKFESELFVTINKTAKQVDADTIIKVQSIMNPACGEAISRRIIENLNTDEPFKNLFELSKTETAPIKTASIIQYALLSLVSCRDIPTSLFKYWLKKEKLDGSFNIDLYPEKLKEYINYCTNKLKIYFKAIKSCFLSAWNPSSKLLKVISLNAFIIAFRDTLETLNGPKDFDFYAAALNELKNVDFTNSKKDFPYAGAQYSKFAKEKIIPLFVKKNERS